MKRTRTEAGGRRGRLVPGGRMASASSPDAPLATAGEDLATASDDVGADATRASRRGSTTGSLNAVAGTTGWAAADGAGAVGVLDDPRVREAPAPRLVSAEEAVPVLAEMAAAEAAVRLAGGHEARERPIPAVADVPAGKPVSIDANPEWTPPSWDEVVRTHSARVYRLAYRLTGNQHDAEDLTQEVFVRVFRSLSTYTPGTFEGWLHRITTNLFLDLVRRRARIRFEGMADDAAERLAGREPSPAQAYHDARLDADVQRALDDLPPEFRAAVVLCDIEGLSYEEIAATLDVKLGTVRSRIHRGRAQLRAALEHRAPRPGHSLPGPTLDGGETLECGDTAAGAVVTAGRQAAARPAPDRPAPERAAPHR